MLSSGEYAWNSGMFILENRGDPGGDLPANARAFFQLDVIKEAWDTPEQEETIREVWPEIKPQTIDFGIMENAEKVAVIPAADLEWNDVGSWEALFDVLNTDDQMEILFRR